jgi:hypothetical protein
VRQTGRNGGIAIWRGAAGMIVIGDAVTTTVMGETMTVTAIIMTDGEMGSLDVTGVVRRIDVVDGMTMEMEADVMIATTEIEIAIAILTATATEIGAGTGIGIGNIGTVHVSGTAIYTAPDIPLPPLQDGIVTGIETESLTEEETIRNLTFGKHKEKVCRLN